MNSKILIEFKKKSKLKQGLTEKKMIIENSFYESYYHKIARREFMDKKMVSG